MNSAEWLAERIAASFPIDEKDDVRRVASWLGFIARGIYKIKTRWWVHTSRRVYFVYDGRRYTVKYLQPHKGGGPSGGIGIVEVEAEPGSPEIGVALVIKDINEAEQFSLHPHLAPVGAGVA